jgi:hypothetical protein
MIKSILEKSKQTFKPKFGYKELFDKNTYHTLSKSTSSDISEHEFIKRYKTMSLCAWASLVFFVGSLLQIPNSSDIIGVIICILASTLFIMFYFSYIYKLWAARITYSFMFEGKELGSLEITRFFDEATVSPENLVPIKITRKAGHG